MDMKTIINKHALKSLLVPVVEPDVNLAVSDDERHTSVPILIFTEQHLPTAKPEVENPMYKSYEEVQKNGTGSSLALDDFETQNFYIGVPFGGV